MFNNILVAIDNSPSAAKALQEATGLAEALKAHLTVIGVVPPLPAFAYSAAIDVTVLEKQVEDDVKSLIRDAISATGDDVATTSVVAHGHPSSEIQRQVSEGKHDLLVLGSRGRGRLASSLLGSVVAEVHFNSHTSMLIVHADEAHDDDTSSTGAP